jgi:hypothetical protein
MTRIESPKVTVSASAETLSQDLNDFQVLGELLGHGPVSEFGHEGDRCHFKVTGGVSIHLVKSEVAADEGEILKLLTEAPTPVKFLLVVVVKEASGGSDCQVFCDADLNPFTKMMVEPALNGLFASMTQALQARYA